MKNRVQRLVGAFAVLAFLSTINLQLSTLRAQGTPFTYQGQLQNNGSLANGTYNLQFLLYTNSSGGTAVAGPVTTNGVNVTNGLFTVLIDFGANVWNGSTNWMEVDVETNGAVSFTTLAPRQQVTPTPYAISAENVSGTVGPAALGGTYGNAVTLNNANNILTGSFTGNGVNVTNVNALSLNGLRATNFWQLGGNNVASGQILGSTNSQALEVRVANQRVLLIATNPADSANLVGGSPANIIDAGVEGAVIAGGGTTNFLGVYSSNRISASFSSIGGGSGNFIQSGSDHAVIGGGLTNLVLTNTYQTVIAGGQGNTAGNVYSVIGGGFNNLNSGQYGVLGGGLFNTNTGPVATLGGGQGNFVSGNSATLSGGFENVNTGGASTLAGGQGNLVNGNIATLSGGFFNTNSGTSATIGGGVDNNASGTGATIGGGGANGISPSGNNVQATAGTIGGGWGNSIPATGGYATISGGAQNTASGVAAMVGGGTNNTVSGTNAVVSGGNDNTASGQAAVVGGGSQNIASGQDSFAAGNQAHATNNAAFVWSDGSVVTTSITNHSVTMRATNGFRFFTGTGAGGAQLLPNATAWTVLSDRNSKKDFAPVDTIAVLNKLATIPVEQWHYQWESETDTPNIGPMAQDFKAAFYPGRDNKGISTLEFDGVELAAIQGLNEKVEGRSQKAEARIQKLESENAELKARLEKLEQLLETREGAR